MEEVTEVEKEGTSSLNGRSCQGGISKSRGIRRLVGKYTHMSTEQITQHQTPCLNYFLYLATFHQEIV